MVSAVQVLKFGGTSVGSPARIARVAEYLVDRIRRGTSHGRSRLVVVVSAMGHTTDELISLAEQVCDGPPPTREMDMLLSSGERIAMALLAMALVGRGISAISFTGSQSGIVTDTSHRRAQIQEIRADRILAALQTHDVVIVAGFQGVSLEREITTLGRGGSDTTAVALGVRLAPDQACEIFTDVQGVYTADPRVVERARWVPTVSVQEVLELAVRGAAVLHPRALELSSKWNVALKVRSSWDFSLEGTHVTAKAMEGAAFRAVAVDRDKVWVEWTAPKMQEITRWLEVLGQVNVALSGQRTVRLHDSPQHPILWGAWVDAEARAELQRLKPELRVREDWRPVALVGSGLSQNGKIVARWMQKIQALVAEEMGPIEVAAQSLVVGVPVARANEVMRALHQEFVEAAS